MPDKYAMSDKVSAGPWQPTTAETINRLFERLFKATQLAGGSSSSGALANGLDVLSPAAGDLIVGAAGSKFGLTSIVTAAQRVLTNNGSVPTWAQVDLATGVTGVLPAANVGSGASATTVLHGNQAFSAVDLAADITGRLPFTHLVQASATQRLVGRNTAAAGDYEEVTLSQLLDWITSAAQGDILYRGAATWARLPAGTSGQYLSTLGTGANPAWASAVTPASNNSLYDVGNYVAFTASPLAAAYLNALGFSSAPTTGGNAPSQIVRAEGFYNRHTLTASGASASNILSVNCLDWSLAFDVTIVLRTGGVSLANLRIWAGFAASAPFAASSGDTASTRFVGFRYTATSGNWQGINFDGTTQSATTDVAAITTNARYKLRIRSDGTQAWFSVNGSAELNLGSNYPGGATKVALSVGLASSNSSVLAAFIDVQRAYGFIGS